MKHKIVRWFVNHKFWSSVFALIILGMILSSFGVVDSFGFGRLAGMLYIFPGSIIWAWHAKKLKWTLLIYLLLFATGITISLIVA